MTAQHVGSALYGLQRMNDSSAEVRRLVAALAPKVQHARIDPQAVGNGVYGLQRMGDSQTEVRKLVAALVPKVQALKQCGEKLKQEIVIMGVYWLRRLGDSDEVQKLVAALTENGQRCRC